ncbi:MAG: hypothetical protein Q8S26_00385 [Azonexus sp.]|nr:hypothetical protein [Azonexus sp.]
MLLIAVVMAGGYAFYRTANVQQARTQQDNKLATAMAQAKDALIAYAVTDSDRPGSLPCPDLITNNVGFDNFPGDGKTDMFTVNQCPIYVGWLPWVTLDLPELTDNTGTRLWYVLAPALRNHDSAQPINSDTLPGLQVDGTTDQVAALIIASRAPLAGQNRPSNLPADYLDDENGNGNDHKYVTGPASAAFNDLVLIITRQELMAAVEKRVANEVKSCLDQHAASAANINHRYPWPAPFSATNREGRANSLFGRVPLTQPASGPEAALKGSIAKLTLAQTTLSTSTDANQQLAALQNLSATLLEARNLFDVIFSTANQLKQVADAVSSQVLLIDSAIDTASLNGRISVSEGLNIRTLNTGTDTLFNSLPDQLAKLGVDVVPWELNRQRIVLDAASTASDLLSSTTYLEQLLGTTATPRLDINLAPAQAAATAARVDAQAAASATATSNPALLALAKTSATTLSGALSTLQASIEATRVSELSSTVSLWGTPISTLQTTLQSTPNSDNLIALRNALITATASVDAIATGVPGILTARSNASSALNSLIAATQVALPNFSQINSDTTTALATLTALSATILSNEQVDNNVSHTSLNALLTAYQTARNDFSTQDTAIPRPLQRNITPYATTLGNAAVNVDFWAKIISANTGLIAPQAKADTIADPTQAAVLNSSAYSTANEALTSVTGKNESLQLLQAFIDNQSAANLASATTALSETSTLLNTLLAQAGQLDSLLSGTTASASPIIWLSSRCDFLQANVNTWWKSNQWANTLFYQISHPLQSTAGTLTVNGAGAYRLLAVAGGRALGTQNHASASSANFLEATNANASRDGDATAPAVAFTTAPPSATFNDRLAY